MQWWCAATARDWDWAWRAYPGVWIVMALVALGYWRVLARARAAGPVPARYPALFLTGLAMLWAMLDWPVGALGAGYLLSVHTGQYLVVTLIAMPVLLLGVPPAALPAPGSGVPARLLRSLANPALGLALSTAALVVTHVPAVTDSFRQSQGGSFAIDLIWLGGAFALWWPVIAPPAYARVSPPVLIGYLFLCTIPPMIPAGFMVFADYPLYAVYELAPRVEGITAAADQKVAGVMMKGGSDPLLWIAMAIVFFRWQRLERDAERRHQLLTPTETTA